MKFSAIVLHRHKHNWLYYFVPVIRVVLAKSYDGFSSNYRIIQLSMFICFNILKISNVLAASHLNELNFAVSYILSLIQYWWNDEGICLFGMNFNF